jgi:hypothetical protein
MPCSTPAVLLRRPWLTCAPGAATFEAALSWTSSSASREDRAMISQEQVSRRIEQLEQLGRKLAREIVVIGEGNDPLLYVERRDYLAALRNALAGIEGARVELCRARQRWRRNQEADAHDQPPG